MKIAKTVLLFTFLVAVEVESAVKCPSQTSNSSQERTSQSVFDFGGPGMFVTSFSQELETYSLIDQHRRTAILEEYLMVGYKKFENDEDRNKQEVYENLRMVIIDIAKNIHSEAEDIPDLIHQNLEKELYWKYFFSTGVFPSMTIVNATRKTKVPFNASEDEANGDHEIAFHATIVEHGFIHEPQPPYDTIFEIPGNSRVLRKEKTMIQYQSFALWRWKLSSEVKTWTELNAFSTGPNLRQSNISEPNLEGNISGPNLAGSEISRFHRIENPCNKDMFLLYAQKHEKSGFYLASPLIQSHLNEHWFYDMSTDEHPWKNEEFLSITLTNDHLVVLTNESLWISQSINDSNVEGMDLSMRNTFSERPKLNFRRTNPCDKYEDQMLCFKPTESYNLAKMQYQLFYNPVCFLYQAPNYDDYIIFVVHDKQGDNDFSVIYSPKPYVEWQILFLDVYYYLNVTNNVEDRYIINKIVGIVFNDHLRLFDITIQVTAVKGKQVSYIRFALPEPFHFFDGYGDLVPVDSDFYREGSTWRELNSLLGEGFVDKKFPENFELRSVVMNGDTHDLFFLGNQLWIAEAGGPFVYPAITGLDHTNKTLCHVNDGEEHEVYIEDCSFNHPDRTFLCMNNARDILFVGKIASHYSPIPVNVENIEELHLAGHVHGWPKAYYCELIRKRSVYVAGYSGKVLMWYLDDPAMAKQYLEEAIANHDISDPCNDASPEPMICRLLKRWKTKRCTAEGSGEPKFEMLSLDPTRFSQRQQNTDGPLVPFLIDSSTAVLFEANVPTEIDMTPGNVSRSVTNHIYLKEVNDGQMIYCKNYDLLKEHHNDPYEINNCEMFVQHLKPVEGLLEGFRMALYVIVIKSIPMLPLPVDIAVLVLAQSNKALVKINDFLTQNTWKFTPDHIGQTLYLPGNFSILLTGFPKEGADAELVMQGYTTIYSQYERRFVYNAFQSFLMDMSTKVYRHKIQGFLPTIKNLETERLREADLKTAAEIEKEKEVRRNITKKWNESPILPTSTDPEGTGVIFKAAVAPLISRAVIEAELLTVTQLERHEKLKNVPAASWTPPPPPPPSALVHGEIPYSERRIWHISEAECNYMMIMDDNPVLNNRGGRISLDLHDTLTFTIRLKSTTPLGKITMHRPLLVVTNTNPDLLAVEKIEHLSGDPQVLELMLKPTGYQKGNAVVSVRSLVSSLKCQQATSLTLIVLLHRDAGRRLHANYPIPLCKPDESAGMYPRTWVTDLEGCVTRDEILDENKPEIVRYYKERRLVAYVTLPANYRPPSFDGTDIPTSKNVYNVDPSKPFYRDWYHISKRTRVLTRCEGAKSKEECNCTYNDRLSDDEFFTECRGKVFTTQRTIPGKPLIMSMSYDPVMRNSHQNRALFTPKLNWSIVIEEVNGRTEWFVSSTHDKYLRKINSDATLHFGRKHYNMRYFEVTFLGTGLFHFKATLGRFESFDEVTGHFIVYVKDELNHIHIFIIMLVTIVFCLAIVFLRFLKSRKRLQAMLPVQVTTSKKKLKVL